MSIQFQYSAIQCNTLQSSPAILKSSQTPLQLYSSPVILQYGFNPVQLYSSPALLQSSLTPVQPYSSPALLQPSYVSIQLTSVQLQEISCTFPGNIQYISRKNPVKLQETSSSTPGNTQNNPGTSRKYQITLQNSRKHNYNLGSPKTKSCTYSITHNL